MTEILLNLLEGFGKALQLFGLTLLGGLPLGMIICFGSMSRFMPIRYLSKLLVWLIRGTPLMLQLMIIFYFPGMFLKNNIWGSGSNGRFIASVVAFVINYACYFSEIFRGGIESIPKGQYEAGEVLGMTKPQIFFRVVLLQVIKRIVPPISNEVITLVKDTSLARIISMQELIWVGEVYINNGLLWPLFYTGFYYLIFNGMLTLLFGAVEKKLDYFKA